MIFNANELKKIKNVKPTMRRPRCAHARFQSEKAKKIFNIAAPNGHLWVENIVPGRTLSCCFGLSFFLSSGTCFAFFSPERNWRSKKSMHAKSLIASIIYSNSHILFAPKKYFSVKMWKPHGWVAPSNSVTTFRSAKTHASSFVSCPKFTNSVKSDCSSVGFG